MVDVPPQPESDKSSDSSSIIEAPHILIDLNSQEEELDLKEEFKHVNDFKDEVMPSPNRSPKRVAYRPATAVNQMNANQLHRRELVQHSYSKGAVTNSGGETMQYQEFNEHDPYTNLALSPQPSSSFQDQDRDAALEKQLKRHGNKNLNWKSTGGQKRHHQNHGGSLSIKMQAHSTHKNEGGRATAGGGGKQRSAHQKSLQYQRLQRLTEGQHASANPIETEPIEKMCQDDEEHKQKFLVHNDDDNEVLSLNQGKKHQRAAGYSSNLLYDQGTTKSVHRHRDNNLSISSIQSSGNFTANQKPSMELLKQIDNKCSIDYDESEFVMSTQEGQLQHYRNVGLPDNETPRINPIRGLTPQKRLMSSQRIDDGTTMDDALSSKIVASTVGDKEQFQSEIAFKQVEPKRSSSVSAKKSAAELNQPYNRRAQLMREKKEQMKLKAREESFQRSQKKTDSINRLYSRPAEGTKGIFSGNMSESQQLFNQSLSVSNQQQSQIQTQIFSGGRSVNQAGYQQDALSFDYNDNPLHQNQQNSMMLSGQFPPNRQEVTVRLASKIQPGNQQFMSQSMLSSSKPIQTEDSSTSGIERAKQMFNEKLSKMVDWGNFTSQLSRQQQQQNGGNKSSTTQRINDRNQVTLTNQPPTFGADNYNFGGVMTPPAMKANFKLAVANNGRIVPYTEREAEGTIPNPNRAKKFPSKEQQKLSLIMKGGAHTADHSVRGTEVTLNPQGHHGVALSVHNQGSALLAQNQMKQQRRMPVGTPARSTKSLRDLLSGSRRQHHNSNIVSSTRELFDGTAADQSQISRGEDLSRMMYASVNSPSTEAMKHHQQQQALQNNNVNQSQSYSINPQQQQQQNQPSQVVSEHNKRLQQEQYPCSAFFQNESNFEKAEASATSSIFQQLSSPDLSMKLQKEQQRQQQQQVQSKTFDLQSEDKQRRITIQGSESKQGSQFITSFHPSTEDNIKHNPANIQGEEDLVASVLRLHQQKCQSPVVARNHKSMHQGGGGSSSKNIVFGRQSLTARKNLTHHQGGKNSPKSMKHTVVQKYQQSMMRRTKLAKETSPRFKVVEQQKEISMGRCSIKSIRYQQDAEDDDLPPDPLLQTISPRGEAEEQKAKMQAAPVEEEEKNAPKQKTATAKTKNQVQKESKRRDKDTNVNTRNEIVAVAPKSSILSLAQQTSETTMMSMIRTDYDTSSRNDFGFGVGSGGGQRLTTNQDTVSVSSRVGNHAATVGTGATKDEIVKVDDENDGKRARGNSFIKDGYEIYVEGTYIVNGRRKKKVKKRKLSKQVIERHSKAIEDKVRQYKEAGKDSSRLERELAAIQKIGEQTLQMAAKSKIVQLKPSQVKLTTQKGADSMGNIQLAKQTSSQIELGGENSPRIQRKLALKKASEQSSAAQSTTNLTSKAATTGTTEQKQTLAQRSIRKIKLQQGAKGQPQVQIPRKLFILNKSPPNEQQQKLGASNPEEQKHQVPRLKAHRSPYVVEEETKGPASKTERSGELGFSASTQSLNFRDPDLQLITSARVITLRDVAASLFDGSQKFILHRMIFKKKFAELLKVFRSGFLNGDQLNLKDHQGNTPLLLAAKLSSTDEEFLKCINFLFKQGCDGKIRDASGWSLIDEAIMQGNSQLLAIAFNWLNIRKKEKIERNKARVIQRLKNIPDFYVELHWECQSSWIPFLSKIAPSDDFQIWKVGSNIRLDFSLVGFKNLQNKRRRMSILFRNAAEDESDERYKDLDILMVNRDREILSNPLEDLDDEEKLAVLTDIMNADPVQNELNITRQEWSAISNFFGGANQRETINGFDCSKFKLSIEAQVRSKKKVAQAFQHSYDSYFEGAEEFKEGQQSEQDPESFKMAKDVTRTVESQLWLSKDYPLQFGQFMEVLDTLAISGQASMQKIHEFLQNECLQDVVGHNGFPVKIQVPIGMIVKAMVTFGNFEFLNPENKEEFVKETFKVPDYCKLVSRKEGMKTLQSKKKRLAVANVVI